ncbi:MAG: hypothetical protein AMXMBFR23_02230 [Chloroflexota bacterium]
MTRRGRRLLPAPANILVAALLGAALLGAALVACSGDESASPEPTPAEAATPVDLEATYIAEAVALTNEVADASHMVAEVAARADVESDAWRAQFTASLNELRALHIAAGQLAPTPERATDHDRLLAATAVLDEAAEALIEAVESLDADALQRASERLATATAGFLEVRALLRAAR